MADVLAKLAALPRARIAVLPTPMEDAPRLTQALGGPRVFVKRDDLTGLALGGNKARQLEFYFGDALAKNADTVLITGAVQSNFVRVCAAGAAKLGLACHIQLEERVAKDDPTYKNSGNVLLDRLLGATLHRFEGGEDDAAPDRALDDLAAKLTAEGKRPYVIHLGVGHPPIGALGYALAAREILDQAEAMNVRLDAVVLASGSAATHGGLLFGLRALKSRVPVIGVCNRRPAQQQQPRVKTVTDGVAKLLGMASPVTDADIVLTDATLAPGYGQPNPMVFEAMAVAARTEALILDPVYTGKAMAGLIYLARRQSFADDANVLFVHTGGQPGLFAYEPQMTAAFGAGAG